MAVETKLVTVSEFVTPAGSAQRPRIVNPVRQTVQVTDFDHTVRTYTIEDAVPLATGASIPVRAIFEK
jgi:hypothetical protein